MVLHRETAVQRDLNRKQKHVERCHAECKVKCVKYTEYINVQPRFTTHKGGIFSSQCDLLFVGASWLTALADTQIFNPTIGIQSSYIGNYLSNIRVLCSI